MIDKRLSIKDMAAIHWGLIKNNKVYSLSLCNAGIANSFTAENDIVDTRCHKIVCLLLTNSSLTELILSKNEKNGN